MWYVRLLDLYGIGGDNAPDTPRTPHERNPYPPPPKEISRSIHKHPLELLRDFERSVGQQTVSSLWGVYGQSRRASVHNSFTGQWNKSGGRPWGAHRQFMACPRIVGGAFA